MSASTPPFNSPFAQDEHLQFISTPFSINLQKMGQPLPFFDWCAVRVRMNQRWHAVKVLSQKHGNGLVQFEMAEESSQVLLRVEITQGERLLEVNLQSPSAVVDALAIDLEARPDEHYLGFGERFNRIDQRGYDVDLQVVNGASGNLAYKPIPFFMSSAGYAVRLLTSMRTRVRLACTDDPGVVSIRTEARNLRFQVWSGKPFEELLRRYASLLGLPLYQPPAWIFGPWKSRDWTLDNQERSLEDMRLPREIKLAGTVKLIDAAWEVSLNDFLFNQNYPEPQEMIGEAHRLGYRIILWIAPWMVKTNPPSSIYTFCAENDFLIKDRNGQPYVHPLGNSPGFSGSCFDFTNPAARQWWQDQIERLTRMGIDGFKTDFGEQVPDDAVFFDGHQGFELHNLFPLLYNQATFEAMQRNTNGVLLARSAWDGSQKYCAFWAGDQSSDFGPATGMPSVIVAGQNAGLSGLSCWTSDIGGYFGLPTEEVFARWIAFGAFSPIMQLHGLGCREPWDYSVRILEIYRNFAQLHLDLFPYIFTFAQTASQTGIPLMRAMSLVFPQDERLWNRMAEYQYMFGSQLLVAPVYFGHSTKRWVYFPAGTWRDFWTGKELVGPQECILKVDLDQIAVFARAGSIIPFVDGNPDTLLESVDEHVVTAGDDLRLQIYPGADGCFSLYDGTRFEWRDEPASLSISHSPVQRWVSIRILSETPQVIRVTTEDGSHIALEKGALNGSSDFSRFFCEPDRLYHIWAAIAASEEKAKEE